jgi:DNA-binding response OmpR family regulator
MQKILVVDDDQTICEVLEFNLAAEGYEILCAHSAEEAMQKMPHDCALIVLDVMMAGMSGYKMAETLRRSDNHTPIIFLTAKSNENDMLTGFSVGADDYIAKPFSVKEIIARIKAILKRCSMDDEAKTMPEESLAFGDMVISMALKEVRIGAEKIILTRTEYEILLLLAKRSHKIFSRQEIIDIVWQDTPYITERTVDVHITRLRKKLGCYAKYISNRSGFGYRFCASDIS